MGETTYNRYKREKQQLIDIINADVSEFMLVPNQKEFTKRLNYIKECISQYRHNEGKK